MADSRRERPIAWVIDDSKLDAERSRAALADTCDVVVFPEASSALERLASGAPVDVLVLDWVLPNVSGIEVCRFLRGSASSAPNVAILLVTGSRDAAAVAEALEAGANDFIAKPFEPIELRARVAAVVRTAALIARLQRSDNTVRELLSKFPDALVTVNRDKRIVFGNDAAGALFGVQASELRGRPAQELVPELARNETLPSLEPGATLRLSDLEVGDRVVAPTVRRLTDLDDLAFTIALRDVTETRAESRRRLDFYSTVAHELRSPLHAMMLRFAVMRGGARYGILPPALVADIQKIEGNVRSLVSLVNDFLDLARLEGAGLKLALEPVDLRDVVRDTVEELAPLAEASDVRLAFEPPVELPTLQGDRHRLVQVVSNLLSNAIKFTGGGGNVRVLLRTDDSCVAAGVQDDGPGIAPEALPTLFERFTRVEQTDRKVAGTGLGLMIVRQIVDAHGGRVWVDSEVGRGSTFWFAVPCGPMPAAAHPG